MLLAPPLMLVGKRGGKHITVGACAASCLLCYLHSLEHLLTVEVVGIRKVIKTRKILHCVTKKKQTEFYVLHIETSPFTTDKYVGNDAE